MLPNSYVLRDLATQWESKRKSGKNAVACDTSSTDSENEESRSSGSSSTESTDNSETVISPVQTSRPRRHGRISLPGDTLFYGWKDLTDDVLDVFSIADETDDPA